MFAKRSLLTGALCLALASVVGCGGVPETKVTVQSSAIVENVKKTLTSYAETGKVGSSMTGLESDINGIASSDSATGATLKQGFLELQQVMNEPEKVKAKAKEMLSVL